MELLYTILLLNIVQQFVPVFAKLLAKLLNYLRYKNQNSNELKQRNELNDLQLEQRTVSMMDEFARHARLQRKIDKLASEIKLSVDKTARTYKITKYIIHYGLQAVFTIYLVAICFNHRSDSVIELPEKWTLGRKSQGFSRLKFN